MKLVNFGSLPLTQIRKEEHDCLDKYLLKHFSDNISFSNAITNLSLMKNIFYITPAKIAESFSNEKKLSSPKYETDKFNNYDNYKQATERAFKVLKNFYIKLHDAPFYKGMLYFPIYIEKYLGDDSKNNTIQSQYKFNFILLTNNLLDSKFKDNQINSEAVVNVLYIYIHIFKIDLLLKGNFSGKTLTNFNQKDLILVMKFYKFIQKYDLNPVSVFLSLYDIISFARKEANNHSGNIGTDNFASRLTSRTSRTFRTFDPDSETFKNLARKISGIIIRDLNSMGTSPNAGTMMVNVIEEILDHKEIYDFIVNLNEKRFTRDSRMQAVADYTHYQQIIKIFENLVAYNSLGLKDIIVDHDINFSKDVILDGNPEQLNLTTIKGIIDTPLLDTVYKKWQNSTIEFISSSFSKLVKQQIDYESNIFHNWKDDPEYKKIVQQTINIDDSIRTLQNEIVEKNQEIADIQSKLNPNAPITKELYALIKVREDLANRFNELSKEKNILLFERNKITSNLLDEKKRVIEEITRKFSNNLDNLTLSFGNIYEDLSNIFLNPIVVNLFFSNEDIQKEFNIGEQSFRLDCHMFRSLIKKLATSNDLKGKTQTEESAISIFISLIQQLETDLNMLLEMYLTSINSILIESTIEVKLGAGPYKILRKAFLDRLYQSMCSIIFSQMLQKIARLKVYDQNKLMYSNELNDIHPILGRMSRNINSFKSFIFDIETIETLYDLIFLTQEKLFYNGLINRPIKKLNSVESKIKTVLGSYLGLEKNTVWITGGGKVRLSMPDYLSLTNIPMLMDIKQSELRKVCKIDYKNLWNEKFIGNDYNFSENKGNKKIAQLSKEISDLQIRIKNNPTDTGLKNLLTKKREEFQKEQKAILNKTDNLIGNIGLNITTDARQKFQGTFSNDVENNLLKPFENEMEKIFEKEETADNLAVSEQPNIQAPQAPQAPQQTNLAYQMPYNQQQLNQNTQIQVPYNPYAAFIPR